MREGERERRGAQIKKRKREKSEWGGGRPSEKRVKKNIETNRSRH